MLYRLWLLLDLFQRHVLLVMLGSFVLGLSLPGVDTVPAPYLSVVLALQLFLACFRTTPTELRDIRPMAVLQQWAARFVLLPVLLYELALVVLPDYAMGVLLLALLPAGVTSPAFAAIFGSNVALSIVMVMLTSFLSLITIPVTFSMLASQEVPLDGWAMLWTLLLVLVVPFVLHLPVRRWGLASRWLRERGSKLVVVLMSATLILAVGRQRESLLAGIEALPISLLWALIFYLCFYLLSWGLAFREPLPNRLSFSLASGLNNVMLGTILATLHLSGKTAMFLLAANVPWILALAPLRWWIERKNIASKL